MRVSAIVGEVRTLTRDPAGFFGAEGLLVAALAKLVAAEGEIRSGSDGRLYRFSDGVYRADGETFVANRVREHLAQRFRRQHRDQVLAWLRADYATITDRPSDDRINLANGILDWRTLTLSPHDPSFVSLNQLPVSWQPTARCPAISRFLRSQLPDDAVEFVFEVIGYAMYPGNPFRKAILLLGPGGSGKSVALHIIESLLGRANISAVPLQTLGENRFAVAELFGKLANICGDLDARAVKTSDIFKTLTGGDLLFAERKHRDHFVFRPYALPIFAANEAPATSDQTSAYFTRWIVIPFERVVPIDTQDPGLRAQLTASAELEGLLVSAVNGLRRLLERGRFTLPASVQAAGGRYQERLDTASAFVEEQCLLDATSWTPRPHVYRAYADWCRENGRRALSSGRLYEHLRLRDAIEERTRRGTRGFLGIRIREDA